MDNLPLVFAFSAGMLASVNPCGFAMLPAFVSYYLGGEDGLSEVALQKRLLRALTLGIVVTIGFLSVFVIAGSVFSTGGRFLLQLAPWLGMIVGVFLIGLGLWYLFGKSISLPIPIPRWQLRTQGIRGMFLYGVAYALVSLGCTLPIFLSVFAGALAANDLLSVGGMFVAYSLGMGTVITALALATALFEGVVTHRFRRLLPSLKVVSAIALIAAGGYLLYSQIVLNPLFRIV
jgi:cytochrome c biogenesis protein CcdA